MTRRPLALACALFAAGCATSNPNVQLGVGLAQTVANSNVPTAATTNSRGTVDETQALDKSPQLVVEIHKTFALGSANVGPMAGVVIPKIRIGESTEDPKRKDEPLGFGFGAVESFKLGSEGERRIHVGVLWEFMTFEHLSDAWQQGKTAPTDRAGLPLPANVADGLVQRGLIVVTVSGVLSK
jgi:hypothetical protein